MAAPIVAVCYVLFARPILAAQFKDLYAEADGFWQTVWALCGKSWTLATSYVVQFVGFLFQAIDPVAEILGDPDLKQQIADALQANPATLGKVMSIISFIVIAARLRGLFKGQ
jgi:hypothetical protein